MKTVLKTYLDYEGHSDVFVLVFVQPKPGRQADIRRTWIGEGDIVYRQRRVLSYMLDEIAPVRDVPHRILSADRNKGVMPSKFFGGVVNGRDFRHGDCRKSANRPALSNSRTESSLNRDYLVRPSKLPK